MRTIKILLAGLIFLMLNASGQSTSDDDKSGVVIVISGGGKVSYEKGVKISEEPEFVDTVTVLFDLDYTSIDQKLESNFEVEPIKPPKLVIMEPLDKITKNYFALGLNDFKTAPFAEYTHTTIRNKEYNGGFHFKHFSSDMRVPNAARAKFTETHGAIHGKKILERQILSTHLDYDYNTFRNYGFDPVIYQPINKEDILLHMSVFKGDFALTSTKHKFNKYDYDARVNYAQLYAHNEIAEHIVGVEGEIGGKYFPNGGIMDSLPTKDLTGNWQVQFKADYLNSQDSIKSNSSTLFKLRPNYKVNYKSLNVTLALPIFFNTNNVRLLTALPTLNFDWAVVKDILILYGGYDRDYYRNYYLTYMSQNPFIGADLPYLNTHVKFDFQAGLRGAFTSKTTFNFGVKYQNIGNFVLFVNDANILGNRQFTVLTDEVNKQQLFAELVYENRKIKSGVLAEYNRYQLATYDAYHLPAVFAQAYAKYNVQDKFKIGLDLFYYGEQLALDVENVPDPTATKLLKPIFDFNFNVDYKYNETFGAFFKLNNILSTRHQRWNQYPNYGINVLGGVYLSW